MIDSSLEYINLQLNNALTDNMTPNYISWKMRSVKNREEIKLQILMKRRYLYSQPLYGE